MDSHAFTLIRTAGLALLLVSAAACGSTPAETPSDAVGPSPGTVLSEPTPAPVSERPADASASAAPTEPAVGPPAAALSGSGPGGSGGVLGSFSWDGFASDAPWLVAGAGPSVRPGASLDVAFDHPDTPPVAWRARWATVVGDGPGAPTDGGSGSSRVIRLTAPASAGTWALQLAAEFGPGRSATWYWRVEVVP